MKIRAFSGDASDCKRYINDFFEDKEVEFVSISTEHEPGSSRNMIIIITYIETGSKT